jgi:hypothetical protein
MTPKRGERVAPPPGGRARRKVYLMYAGTGHPKATD